MVGVLIFVTVIDLLHIYWQVEKGGMIDYTYYCDVCDKGCKNEELFNRHLSEHQKCSVPDCNYVAVPKLIKLHYDMVSDSVGNILSVPLSVFQQILHYDQTD